MKAKPNVSAEQLARLRAKDEPLRPTLEAEMPAVREEWRQSVRSLTGVVSRHSALGVGLLTPPLTWTEGLHDVANS